MLLNEALGAEIVYWFKEVMGLQDWTVDLYVQDAFPSWIEDRDCWGMCQPILEEKRAKIWVSPLGCRVSGYDPIDTLMHELGHMLLADLGIGKDAEFPVHFSLYRLAAQWAKAYKYDKEQGWKAE